METVTVLAGTSIAPPSDVQAAPASTTALTVTATYLLSEEGRKASLLAGGDGRAVQELRLHLPVNGLHLVAVDATGVARLKLRPRYNLNDEQRVVRVDAPPTYDAPPSLDDLFGEAARNHQLEATFYNERRTARSRQQSASDDKQAALATAFLTDSSRRAVAHPPPTAKRCYVVADAGRVLFDVERDLPPARDVPPEAYRRFRSDLRARRDRSLQERAAQVTVHKEKERFAADWIAAHGTPEQQRRQDAGMLPLDEVIAAISDHVFAALDNRPRYAYDGAERLQAFLREYPEYADCTVTPAALRVTSSNAVKASAEQFALVNEFKTLMPSANVTLRVHKLSWRAKADAPQLTIFGVLVMFTFGPFTVRREYEAPPD